MITSAAWRCALMIVALSVLMLATKAIAQPTNGTAAKPAVVPVGELAPPAIRKIYVPADSLDPEARGLLPLPRAEFDKRMSRFAAKTKPEFTPPEACITQAVYRASLRNEQLTQGTAELTLERRQAATTEHAWLTLSPCNLAIGVPTWQEPDISAIFGQNANQQLQLAVPALGSGSQAGVLKFPWSLRGRRDERGRVKFVFDLPPALRQRLELRVPATWMLTSDTAVPQELKSSTAAIKAGEVADSLWQVEVTGDRRVQLFAQPRQADAQTPPLVLVRETGSYVFTPGQMDLELSLELDINRAPLRQIRVRHDPRLQWTAVRWGEQSLTWTTEKSSNNEPVVVITLPEPLLGPSRLIQLTAVADWTPGAQKWTLPRASVEDALWQEGRVNIAAPRWLQLDAVAGPGGRLSATTLASDSQGMDLLQFQLERNTAAIEVQPASIAFPLDATSLLTLQVEPKQIVANFAAELSVSSGQHFSLECEVPRTWVIDALETSPPELLEDRVLRPRGNQQIVTLQLRQPIRAGRPIRINARLRHVRATGAESWGDDMLQPIRFLAAANSQRYVTLQLADASFEPRLLNADGLEFLTAAALPAKVRALSESPLGSWLVRVTDAVRQPRFQLAPGSAHYAAASTLQLQLSGERVDYQLQIQCEPESSAVSSLLVQLRPAPASDPQWLLAGEERPLVAQRVEAMMATADQVLPALYRIELPRARDTKFVVRSQWSEPLIAPTLVPLAELPEANSLAAHVEIFGTLDGPFTWQAQRLRPLPFAAATRELRARYRYQAGQEATLTIAPLPDSQRPFAGWISRCDLDSEFSPTGAGRHEARFAVTGSDIEVLELRLPENARLARATVDGREVLAFSAAADTRWLSIPLRQAKGTAASSSPLVRIEYTSPPNRERAWLTASWTAPIPTTRVPVLQSYWQVRLPGNWQPWPSNAAESFASTNRGRSLFNDSLLALLWPNTTATPLARDLPTGAEEQIVVYSPTWFGLLGLVLAILSAGCVLRLRSWNPFHLLAAAVVWLALSLLLGEPWASFVQAILAGWLTGFALQLFQQPIKLAPQLTPPLSTEFAWQPSARLWLLLVCVWLLSNMAYSQQPGGVTSEVPAKDAAKPWRVVIPIGDDEKPTEYVYVSPALYEALFRAETRGSENQPAWLVRSAQYDLRWHAATADAPAELQGYLASFEIETFQEQGVLRLPFLNEQVRLSDPGVKIEGEAASTTWSAAGDALQIEFTGIGRKRLEIGLALVTPPKDGAVGATIRIPPVANSRVLINSLPTGENVVIASAQGSEQALIGGVWQVDLGSTEQLTVQWSRAAAEAAPSVEVEQLLLWRMRPSSVVVEGKWEFRALTGKLREVVLRADPRFRLLPIGNGTNIVRQFSEEGETHLHHFVLDRPTTGDVTLTASFLLVGSTGIGNLVPPRLEPVADRTTRDWQAVWTAPGLQWSGKTSTLPAAEFLQAWGDAALTPVQAFRSTADAPRPTLAVVAVQNRLQAQEQMEWLLTPENTTVHYRLSGTLLLPNVNQLRFQLPPQLAVRRVVVSQNEASVATRWFRHSDGLLTILLDETRAEPWVVEVVADRAHVPGKSTTLPVLQTSEIDVQHYECIIRKRAGAAVTLGKLAGWKEATPDAAAEEPATSDRLVAHLDWSSPRPGNVPQPVPVTLGASLPSFSGELLTRILTEDDDWQLEVIARLRSAGGTFDEVQFSIPRDWEGPFELDPPGRYQLESLPGQSRNLLRVQLEQPVADQLQLRIKAPLAVEQELIRLPVVDLIGNHEALQRLIALPRRGADSPLQWQVAGLQLRADLPEELTNLAAGSELIYEAIIDRYRATARPERVRRESPRIVLAEHHVAWQADRRIVGHSEWMVLPNGARTLQIQPPAAHELVAAIVNDVPAPLRREPGISGAATVELHSDTWPQWVQVIYRGVLAVNDNSSGRWEFSAPRASGVPVDQTRWQIVGPALLQLPPEQAQASSAAPDAALAPFEALVAMAQGAAEAPPGNHAESASTWLALWRRRWDREVEVISKRPPSSPLAPLIAARLQTLANEMADQLNTPLIKDPHEASLLATPQIVDALHESIIFRPLHELHFNAAGDLPNLIVTRQSFSPATNPLVHWLIAAGLLMGAAVIAQCARHASWRDWVSAYPQLVLALFGVAALAIPGYLWLGGLLLTYALLATIHSPWQQQRV